MSDEKISLYITLTIGALISLFPFYWAFIGATNESGKLFSKQLSFVPGTKLIENVTNLNESIGIGRVLFNSLFVSLTYTIFSLLICTMAAYAFAKFEFKGSSPKVVLEILR
ncbi:Lactose transport system permease protein LacG [Anoxybacillus sp. BCO1]|nr:Lactose transport system permease protein LacG [Anoxybacillus sp. BCO1]